MSYDGVSGFRIVAGHSEYHISFISLIACSVQIPYPGFMITLYNEPYLPGPVLARPNQIFSTKGK
jgi:hypothetical protein